MARMDYREKAISVGPSSAAHDDPAIIAEVERLLARRTRDIRLKGEIKRLFRARVWSQTAKIIRAWMIWVAFLDVLTLALNMLMLPRAIALSMLLPGAIIPPAVAAVVLVWRKPRAVPQPAPTGRRGWPPCPLAGRPSLPASWPATPRSACPRSSAK